MKPMFDVGIRRKVGWFVMLGLGSVVVILLLIGLRSDLFADKYRLTFSPATASGFYIGQPVRLQGFIVGRVDAMQLQPDGRVRIDLAMLERYRGMLHRDCTIELGRDGLIGEQLLQISGGDASKPTVQDGQSVTYRDASTIEQLIKEARPAVEHANTLLRELSELATWLNDPNSDIRQVAARLNSATEHVAADDISNTLQSMQGVLVNLEALSGDLKEQRVAKQLAESLQITSRILAQLEPISVELSKQGPATVRRIDSLIAHVDKLSASLDLVASDLSELTPELPGLARESRRTIGEMRKTLSELQSSWLIGGHADQKQEKPAEITPPVLEMQP